MHTIKVPHEESEIEFCTTEFPRGDSRGDYLSMKPQIDSRGMRPPNISEVVSLVYHVITNPKNPEFDVPIYEKGQYSDVEKWRLHHLLYSGWIIGFTGNLYVPQHGVYIQDNPPLHLEEMQMDKEELHERLIREDNGVLYSEDETIRFAPWDNIPRGQDDISSNNNAHIIGLVGEQGRQKLEKIANMYSLEGFISGNKRLRNQVIGRSSIQTYGVGKGVPRNISEDEPGAYMYKCSFLDLSPLGGLDARPFKGAGSSFAIVI